MPSGNEDGANNEWLPGGKLPTGYSEAVIHPVPEGSYVEQDFASAVKRSKKMRVIKKKPYSYVLMEFEGDWILTFLLGGPVELDVSVKLTADEINEIKSDDSSVDRTVNDFKSTKALYESRKVVPTIWPSEQR